MQFVAVGEAFDGADLLAVGLDCEHQAGAHRLVVDDDGAGAADAMLAADMGAGQPAIVADGVDQRFARLDPNRIIAAVDVQGDVEFFVHASTLFPSPLWGGVGGGGREGMYRRRRLRVTSRPPSL